jgi:hypothetical protein
MFLMIGGTPQGDPTLALVSEVLRCMLFIPHMRGKSPDIRSIGRI